jgi:hypothetical protein
MSKKPVDIEGVIHRETEKAVLVSDTGDPKDAKWLPLSQIEIEFGKSDVVTITLPEELAIEKGLV